jgi:hypothetical protein
MLVEWHETSMSELHQSVLLNDRTETRMPSCQTSLTDLSLTSFRAWARAGASSDLYLLINIQIHYRTIYWNSPYYKYDYVE